MQKTIAKYILFLFFTVFITNAVTTMLEKKSDAKALCLQANDDNSDVDDKPEKNPDQTKVKYNPNTGPSDDDICHEFHFSNYFVHVHHLKYNSSEPSLLDAAVKKLYSPPKA